VAVNVVVIDVAGVKREAADLLEVFVVRSDYETNWRAMTW
jgi:hypothetical protein